MVAARASQCHSGVGVWPDFSDWQVRLSASAVEAYIPEARARHGSGDQSEAALRTVADLLLLCCPEDHQCHHEGCVSSKALCIDCRFPVCLDCMLALQKQQVVPQSLANDN